ncbi:cysteine-rich repeat secretory protein 38-like [Humulus lupulus]|uniref:cysteine-rich repeat secretory protein 38-like n=1 Tax=Humulus lupulus TaxID=3486 RepID=UPI002B4091B6|nr:cysteine-rich repeat secretory protein 38-like [Humulus lupulus]
MSFSKPNPLFLTFSILLPLIFLHAANATDPLFHFCFNKENFTSNSPFAKNLNELLTNRLPIKVPPTGFGVSSTGQGGGGNSQVNGLGLCRGDVSTESCKTCVADAAKELQERCPYNKGAIVWYDNCLLKYSDGNFFGQIDSGNRFYMWNVKDVDNPESFNPKVKELLSGLSYKASRTSKLYATGELELGAGPDPKLYGLAQCTRDLNGMDCKKCLDDAISELPNCCTGKIGGRVVGGSCYVRYEVYSIVDA